MEVKTSRQFYSNVIIVMVSGRRGKERVLMSQITGAKRTGIEWMDVKNGKAGRQAGRREIIQTIIMGSEKDSLGMS